MITRYLINCDIPRPEKPFIPVSVPCGSARTIGVVGLRGKSNGVTVSGCRIRITNTDGVAVTKDCVWKDGAYTVTFPASHFEHYGDVKRGVVVFAVGKDENGNDQLWVERVGDLRVTPVDASSLPGEPGANPIGGDVYHKSEIIDGTQHYKREVIVFSQKQNAWGAEYVGDYIIVGGEYVPFTTEG